MVTHEQVAKVRAVLRSDRVVVAAALETGLPTRETWEALVEVSCLAAAGSHVLIHTIQGGEPCDQYHG